MNNIEDGIVSLNQAIEEIAILQNEIETLKEKISYTPIVHFNVSGLPEQDKGSRFIWFYICRYIETTERYEPITFSVEFYFNQNGSYDCRPFSIPSQEGFQLIMIEPYGSEEQYDFSFEGDIQRQRVLIEGDGTVSTGYIITGDCSVLMQFRNNEQ